MNVSGPADTMDSDRQGTRRRQGEDPYGMGRAGRKGGAGVPGKSPGPQGCVTTLCEGCVGQPNKNSRGKNAESARVRSYVWGVRVPPLPDRLTIRTLLTTYILVEYLSLIYDTPQTPPAPPKAPATTSYPALALARATALPPKTRPDRGGAAFRSHPKSRPTNAYSSRLYGR